MAAQALLRFSFLLSQPKIMPIYMANSIRHCSNATPTKSAPLVKKKAGPPELEEKKWQLEFHQKDKGIIAGKLPFKMRLKKGKTYKWCTCGHSKTQPLCDFTHHRPQLKISLKPMVFKAPDDIDVWFCTCKQSNNRPFCDGAHRKDEVQDANV